MKTNFNDPADKIAEGIKQKHQFDIGKNFQVSNEYAYKHALYEVQGLLEVCPEEIIEGGEFDWTTEYEIPNPVFTKLQEVEAYLNDKLK